MPIDFKEIDPQELNDSVWATIKPSKVHGVGVFAIRDIKKDQKLYFEGNGGVWLRTDLSKVIPEIRKLILQRWPIEKDGYPYLSPNDDAVLICFTNHSDKPNYDKYTDKALKNIKKGEEIFEDYGDYKSIVKIK